MSDDIVRLLRSRNGSPTGFGLGPVCDKAAARIESDAAEIERLRAEVAAERERWRALLDDARQWLGQPAESPQAMAELNALLRRVNEACSLWHDSEPNAGGNRP